jgi:hypothetical protein
MSALVVVEVACSLAWVCILAWVEHMSV